MLSGDENEIKPVKKSARKGKTDQDGKKAEPRKRKSAPRQDPQPEQVLQAEQVLETVEAVSAPVPPAEDSLTDVLSSEVSPVAEVTLAEADEAPDAQPEQLLDGPELIDTQELIGTAVTSIETVAIDVSPSESFPVVLAASAEVAPVSYQTIADAYRRYTTESLDRTQTFFGRLAGVRSLDKAFELQSEFARQAYDGFVAESVKIRELHNQLARQRLQQWEGFVARMISSR
jgi:hypothetical protein